MRLIPLAVAFTALPLISPCSVKVDFTADGGRLERALHSSGFAPALSPRPRPGTDEALRLARDMGLKIFYRLGSSIEHTEDGHHWNIVVKPDDVAQYVEACAGIVRHYTQGWADGFRWDIPYWEIWTEWGTDPLLWAR